MLIRPGRGRSGRLSQVGAAHDHRLAQGQAAKAGQVGLQPPGQGPARADDAVGPSRHRAQGEDGPGASDRDRRGDRRMGAISFQRDVRFGEGEEVGLAGQAQARRLSGSRVSCSAAWSRWFR